MVTKTKHGPISAKHTKYALHSVYWFLCNFIFKQTLIEMCRIMLIRILEQWPLTLQFWPWSLVLHGQGHSEINTCSKNVHKHIIL